jgi:histone H3/H4
MPTEELDKLAIDKLAKEYIDKALETEKNFGGGGVSEDVYREVVGHAAQAFRDLAQAREEAIASQVGSKA